MQRAVGKSGKGLSKEKEKCLKWSKGVTSDNICLYRLCQIQSIYMYTLSNNLSKWILYSDTYLLGWILYFGTFHVINDIKTTERPW